MKNNGEMLVNKDEEFRKIYCERHKIFNLIKDSNWLVTGATLSLFTIFLGIFVGKAQTLGIIGFIIGALVDLYLRWDYDSQLIKFREGKSRYDLNKN